MPIDQRFTSLFAIWLCCSSAHAAVITFEEVGAITGGSGTLVFPGTIGDVDIGSLGIFDTGKANIERMSVSSPNAGFLERSVEYSFRMAAGQPFTFISADVARSHVDSSFFRFIGFRNGQTVFSVDTSEHFSTSPDPFHFVANWNDIDKLTLLWGPPVASGFASLDNFTYEISAVPAPGAFILLLSGLLGAASIGFRERPDYLKRQIRSR